MELGQCPADPEGLRTLNDLLANQSRRRAAELSERQRMQLSYPLASVMCIYQVKHASLGGDAAEGLRPVLPELLKRVQALLPEPVNAEATLSIAETDPVRMAAAAAYHRIFSIE